MSVLQRARLLSEEGEPNTIVAGAMEEEDDVSWVNDVYSQLNGPPASNGSTGCQRWNKYRLLSGLCSLLLIGLSTQVVLVPRSRCVAPSLPSMNANCDSVAILSASVAMVLGITGILGFAACLLNKQPSLSVCLAMLLFFYALLCGACITYAVYARVHRLDGLHRAWRGLVSVQSRVICDIQKTLHCSGFESGQCCRSSPFDVNAGDDSQSRLPPCFLLSSNGTTYDVQSREEIQWPGTMCLLSCEGVNALYEQTCEAPLKSAIKAYFFHFVSVMVGLTVFFGLLSGIALAAAFWKPYIDSRMRHRY